jgi:hypothetical protein
VRARVFHFFPKGRGRSTGSIRMKFFDFGVEFFFWVYQSGYGALVLKMKKTCHSGVKKVF